MAPDERSEDSSFLAHYGNCIAAYEGKGTLTFKDALKVKCRFRAGQLATGEVILLCDGMELDPYSDTCGRLIDEQSELYVASLHGKTCDGFQVRVDGGFSFFNYLTNPPTDLTEAWAAFGVRELSIQARSLKGMAQALYGLTNVDIFGTERIEGRPISRFLPLSLELNGARTETIVKPVEDRIRAIRELRALRGMEITAKATGHVSTNKDIERLDKAMDTLCYLLSVARGTRVQWLFRHVDGSGGKRLSSTHYGRAKKPYSPLCAIGPRMNSGEATKAFLEGAFAKWGHGCAMFEPAVNMYLDAKAEADSLEARSAKMALAMEGLKAAMLGQLSSAKEYVIPEKEFSALRKDVDKTLEDCLESHGWRLATEKR